MKKTIYLSVTLLFITISVLTYANEETISYLESKTAYVELAEIVSTDNIQTMQEAGTVDEIQQNNEILIPETINNDTTIVQNSIKDQIIVKKRRVYVNNIELKRKELKSLLNSNPESAAEYKKSKSNLVGGIITLFAVDVALVATTGYILGVIPGMLVTLPFSAAQKKHFNKAVAIYNSKYQTGSNTYSPQNKSADELKESNENPIAKGNYIIGGGASGGLTSFNKDNKGTLYGSLSSDYGRFICNGLAVGLNINASVYSDLSSDYFRASSGIGPFIKYYIPSGFFIGTSINYSNSHYRNSSYDSNNEYYSYKSTSNDFYISPSIGYAYFIKSKIALEAALNYQHYINHNSNTYSNVDGDYKGVSSNNNNSLFFSLGFHFFW